MGFVAFGSYFCKFGASIAGILDLTLKEPILYLKKMIRLFVTLAGLIFPDPLTPPG
jgi:hypothetical protein